MTIHVTRRFLGLGRRREDPLSFLSCAGDKPFFSAPVGSFVGCLFNVFAAGRPGDAEILVVVDGKWNSDPSRNTFIDLGLCGGNVFDVTVMDTRGCLGDVDGDALFRRASLPRRAKNARLPPDPTAPSPAARFIVPVAPVAAAQAGAAADICAADFEGATTSVHHAQGLLGIKVELVFDHCPHVNCTRTCSFFFARR